MHRVSGKIARLNRLVEGFARYAISNKILCAGSVLLYFLFLLRMRNKIKVKTCLYPLWWVIQ